jgi:uncharacterized protein
MILQDDFKANILLANPHLQTIIPHLFRKISPISYQRERLELLDGDFIDLDWKKNHNRRICILLHGLESSSDRDYIYGMVNTLLNANYDCVVMNMRGCSGEQNRKLKAYHSGKTEDLDETISYITSNFNYHKINLIGFSLGGNVVLKYAGEKSETIHQKINKIVAISAPIDLASSSKKLEDWTNKIYHNRFLNSLKNKVILKKDSFKNQIVVEKINSLKTIKEFDDYYTAPVNKFQSADEYYRKASSKPFLNAIKTPTLIINSEDDPFLTKECMPLDIADNHDYLHCIQTKKGGHVGFCQSIKQASYWHEAKTLEFLQT